jgi:hypothetical protein
VGVQQWALQELTISCQPLTTKTRPPIKTYTVRRSVIAPPPIPRSPHHPRNAIPPTVAHHGTHNLRAGLLV